MKEGGSINSGLGVAGPSIGAAVNEGPVAPVFLENTMPLTLNNFKPLGEIIFNPFKGKEMPLEPTPSVLSQAEGVAAKAWEAPLASQGETLEAQQRNATGYNESRPRSVIATVSVPDVIQAQRTKTALEAAGMVDLSRKVVSYLQPEVRQVYYQTLAVSTPSPQERQVEQIVEEKKIESRKEDKPQEKRSEKQSVAKIKLVEAVQISEKRRLEIKAAVKRAMVKVESEGLKAITGRLVARLLSYTFWEHKSPIVGQGRDGTLNPTAEAIREDLTEYISEEDAQTGLVQAVSKHIPVKGGEGGRLATVGEVREVLEGKEKETIKSQAPAEIMVIGLVRENNKVASTGQAVNTLMEEKEEVVGESTLKSLGLEELFPKAA